MDYLKAYQEKLGLVADGKMGPNTAKAMMADLGITDKLFFAHMMGQVAHESGLYKNARENLNYGEEGLLNIFKNIIIDHEKVDGIVICTILGGCYIDDVYISWKSPDCKKHSKCMISGMLNATPHIHHKPFTLSEKYLNKLEVIGCIDTIPVYSSLGDTDCVIKSIDLDSNTIAINMGTGSQIITKNKIERYFPCGRMLLVYKRFFAGFGVNMFDLFDCITLNDIISSSLKIDLSVFSQARGYNGGGSIIGINENDFNITNLVGSLIKHMVLQYKPFVGDYSRILLLGGVAKKIRILPKVFEFYYKNCEVVLIEDEVESTHKGLIKIIEEDL